MSRSTSLSLLWLELHHRAALQWFGGLVRYNDLVGLSCTMIWWACRVQWFGGLVMYNDLVGLSCTMIWWACHVQWFGGLVMYKSQYCLEVRFLVDLFIHGFERHSFNPKASSVFSGMLSTQFVGNVKSNLDKQSVSKLLSRNTIFSLISAPGAYWRTMLKRGSLLFPNNRNCSHAVLKLYRYYIKS